MRFFLSGWQATNRERETAVLKAGAIKHRCFSFGMLCKLPGLPYYLPKLQGAYEACLEHGVGIMMDSGVVSYRSYRVSMQKQGKSLDKLLDETTFIQMYVDYVKKESKKWDFYVTIDIERDAANIFARHCKICLLY